MRRAPKPEMPSPAIVSLRIAAQKTPRQAGLPSGSRPRANAFARARAVCSSRRGPSVTSSPSRRPSRRRQTWAETSPSRRPPRHRTQEQSRLLMTPAGARNHLCLVEGPESASPPPPRLSPPARATISHRARAGGQTMALDETQKRGWPAAHVSRAARALVRHQVRPARATARLKHSLRKNGKVS